jgi:lysophospholipid acyltransferase (LPLAT)-like uncharacterized protein
MNWLFARALYYFYRLMYALWRIEIVEHPRVSELRHQKSPLILAHWHGDELALFHMVKSYRLATMTSKSQDGSTVDYLIRRLGGETSRGSSSRGGVSALKGLVRLLRSGRITSIAVDGPRGPIHVPKPGVFELSKLGSAEIVPVGVQVGRAVTSSRSWNKIYLPLPFTKVCIYLGPPLRALQRNDDARDPLFTRALSDALGSAKMEAAKIFAAPGREC